MSFDKELWLGVRGTRFFIAVTRFDYTNILLSVNGFFLHLVDLSGIPVCLAPFDDYGILWIKKGSKQPDRHGSGPGIYKDITMAAGLKKNGGPDCPQVNG